MSFEAHDYSVGNILNKSVFLIPRNQRRYVWKKTNWQELFEDILNSIHVGFKPHFIGSVVYQESIFCSARGFAKRYLDKEFIPEKRSEFLAKLIYNNILELDQFNFSED